MKPDAQLLLQHHDPEWLSNVQPGIVGQSDGFAISLEAVSRTDETTQMTLRYDLAGSSWFHSFSAVALSDQAIRCLLAENGFCPVAWSEPSRRWIRAVLQSSRHA
ncbi:hypothetical protein [Piscinibacter sp.]|uniref:hypothetical protein n=1 Tax=Piscinibacter sp. TaxID=1903157 RepID=UPI002BC89681|nr:hypothetical protein [Albitalea sp.]HUG20965.1 hypothetical protein [Albitalea sp.]